MQGLSSSRVCSLNDAESALGRLSLPKSHRQALEARLGESASDWHLRPFELSYVSSELRYVSKKHDLSHSESRDAPGMKVLGTIDDLTQIEMGPTVTCVTVCRDSGEKLKVHTLVVSFAMEASSDNDNGNNGVNAPEPGRACVCAVLAHSDLDECMRWYKGISKAIDNAKIFAGKSVRPPLIPDNILTGMLDFAAGAGEDLGVCAPGSSDSCDAGRGSSSWGRHGARAGDEAGHGRGGREGRDKT